eukprot:1281625-Prymnesium_polylepis.3
MRAEGWCEGEACSHLALGAAHRLVDHHARLGQRQPLAARAGTQDKGRLRPAAGCGRIDWAQRFFLAGVGASRQETRWRKIR